MGHRRPIGNSGLLWRCGLPLLATWRDACDNWDEKTPGSFPPGAVVQANFTSIRRSGIEVAMDAELDCPRALVRQSAGYRRLRARSSNGGHTRERRVEVRVDHVQTEIGRGVDIELGPRTDVPVTPVVVAARPSH